MREVIVILLLLALILTSSARATIIEGRIVDEGMEDLLGAQVTNTRTHQRVTTNKRGIYNLAACVGDTILYNSIFSSYPRPYLSMYNGK